MNFNSIIDRQKLLLEDLENQVKAFEASDIAKENSNLKNQLAKLKSEHENISQKAKELKAQNANLTNALYDHAYGEKVNLIANSHAKIEILFSQENNYMGELNRLTALENKAKIKAAAMKEALSKNRVDIDHTLHKKIDELEKEIQQAIHEARKTYELESGAFSQDAAQKYSEMREEQITKEQIINLSKKNNFERFIGLNLLNTLGILLIIVGAIAAGQFVQVRMTDTMRVLAIFAAGFVMLAAGEIMNRRKANVFSLGITAGGVALLYVGVVLGYFAFDFIDVLPALGIVVIITAAAFLLSTRYRSQTLLILAFVGGYMPLFAIGARPAMVYGAMVYFLILNLLDLLVSFKMKWTISSYIGLFFNMASTTYIAFGLFRGEGVIEQIVVISFVFLSFFSYTIIPLISTYRTKAAFVRSDVILLGINTFLSCVSIYALFMDFMWQDFMGLLALIFAIVYLGLAVVLWKKFENANSMRDLFLLTGIVFVVLIVPFQFDVIWISLGWLLQGFALSVYGIIMDNRRFRHIGFVIFGLCVGVFLIVDVYHYAIIFNDGHLLGLKYMSVTLASVGILCAYLYKKALYTENHMLYKYVVLLNLWAYSVYLVYRIYQLFPYDWSLRSGIDLYYLMTGLLIIVTFLLGFAIPRIKVLNDRVVQSIGLGFYGIGKLMLLWLNYFVQPGYYNAVSSMFVVILSGVIVVVLCLVSMATMYDMLRQITARINRGVSYLPVFLSAYGVIILTQIMIYQFGFAFSSMWISFIYVCTALAWIILGFAKRYMFLRRYGLALALLSVAKLFLIDLAGLTQANRIVSYFVLGAVLLGISFVYQYFNKRLELKIESEKPTDL